MSLAHLLPLVLLLAEDRGQTIAVEAVTVIPADRERVIPDQTVLVRDGRITEMGPSIRARVPAGAQRIDGRHRFLMPGLVEMHAHLPDEKSTEDIPLLYSKLFLCNGVTTVRALRGAPNQLSLRDRIERGELLGPRLVVYGPGMLAENTPTPEAGVRQVRAEKAAGYDGVKIIEGLDPPTYRAILRAARQLGLPVAGHVPDSVGLASALAAGQRSIEHLDGFIEALAGDAPPPDASQVAPFRVVTPAILDQVDESRLPGLVAATIRARAFVVPTLVSQRVLFGDLTLAAAGLQYLPPRMVDGWAADQARWDANPRPPAQVSRLTSLRNRVVAAIAGAGGQVMLGSDASRRWSVPGFSLRREVEALAAAGMTPWQLVQAATATPARYFGWQGRVGTVAVGRRADLLLVDGNPLEDAANMFRQSGVMAKGRWVARVEIDRMLGEIARRLRFPPPAEVEDLVVTAGEAAPLAGSYHFTRGNQTAVVAFEKGALVAMPRGDETKKMRLRSQGGGVYLVPEMKSKITFEMRDGRAAAMLIDSDAALQRGSRVP
jgi:imidazolonepropionase-like amidohydrolase